MAVAAPAQDVDRVLVGAMVAGGKPQERWNLAAELRLSLR